MWIVLIDRSKVIGEYTEIFKDGVIEKKATKENTFCAGRAVLDNAVFDSFDDCVDYVREKTDKLNTDFDEWTDDGQGTIKECYRYNYTISKNQYGKAGMRYSYNQATLTYVELVVHSHFKQASL